MSGGITTGQATIRVVAPTRVEHTYTQHLCAPPGDVFPLLCPVREAEWAPDWQPVVVYSDSGVAEPDCVFVTPGDAVEDVWMITRHDVDDWIVEMVMLTPGVIAMHATFALRPEPSGCAAEMRYVKTSLGPAGDEEVARFTESAWHEFMEAWERQMNDHLRSSHPQLRSR